MADVSLNIKRNIYPRSHWHWAIIADGHLWRCESYSNLLFCIVGAMTVGVYSVLKVEKDLKYK